MDIEQARQILLSAPEMTVIEKEDFALKHLVFRDLRYAASPITVTTELEEAAVRDGITYLAIQEEDCGVCLHSSGQLDGETCRRCGGSGKVKKTILGGAMTQAHKDWFKKEVQGGK